MGGKSLHYNSTAGHRPLPSVPICSCVCSLNFVISHFVLNDLYVFVYVSYFMVFNSFICCPFMYPDHCRSWFEFSLSCHPCHPFLSFVIHFKFSCPITLIPIPSLSITTCAILSNFSRGLVKVHVSDPFVMTGRTPWLKTHPSLQTHCWLI